MLRSFLILFETRIELLEGKQIMVQSCPLLGVTRKLNYATHFGGREEGIEKMDNIGTYLFLRTSLQRTSLTNVNHVSRH